MTPDEINRILDGMSVADRIEFLELLELKEREEATSPVDLTMDVRALLAAEVRRAANATEDPAAFMAGYDAQKEAHARHLKRLRRGQPKPEALHDLLRQSLPDHADHVEAARLATEEGFPDPLAAPLKPEGHPMGGPLGLLQKPAAG
jgi:hypothetical protein